MAEVHSLLFNPLILCACVITGSTTRSSPLTVQQPSSSSIGSTTTREAGPSSYRTRKSTHHTLLPSESELINRLRREAAERTGASPLTILDNDDDGLDDVSAASDGSRHRKRSNYLSRLDEDSALSSRAARRSISRELFNNPMEATRPVTSARPVTRRSVSRELQLDGLLSPPPTSSSGRRSATDFTRSSRERSLGRDLEATDNTSSYGRRSESLTRGGGMAGTSSTRPSLASQGRSLTQNEFGPGGRLSSQLSPLYSGSSGYGGDDEGGYLSTTKRYGPGGLSGSRYASLEDRGRSDWRRVSVPERGKDFKSLPRKYNRYTNSYGMKTNPIMNRWDKG